MKKSLLLIMTLSLLAAGCSGEAASRSSSNVTGNDNVAAKNGDESSSAEDSSSKPKITAEVMTWDETQKLIDEKHKGKVVVVDLWATW